MKNQLEASTSARTRGPVYRSAGGSTRVARDLAFDRLPSAVRDRLTRGIVHGAMPDPILAAPSGWTIRGLRVLVALAVLAGVGLLGVWFWDFGELRGKYAIEPVGFTLIYGALLAIVIGAGAAAVHLRRFQRGAPFPTGRYLFPLDLVEASGGRLRVTSLDTRCHVEARTRAVALVFEGGPTVVFPIARREDPAAMAVQINAAIEAARALAFPADEVQLSRIDPFFEVRVTDDWDAAADAAGTRRRPVLAWVAAAGVVGAVPAGYGLVQARNALSDDSMFEQATTDRTIESRSARLVRYADRGQRHLDEVARLLVEGAEGDRATLHGYMARGGRMAELADDALFKMAGNSADELARYLRRGGRHDDDADDALFAIARRQDALETYNLYLDVGKRHADEVRKELLPEADFRQAVKTGLVGSLFSFVRRAPGSKHEDEAWRRIHEMYAGALPAFKATEQPSAAGLRFVEAMLSYLQERADPRVNLVISMVPTTAVIEADGTLSAKYGARYLPAADRFRSGALQDLSRDIHGAVAAWFGGAFPHGVAEISRPSGDELRPRFDIRCEPVVLGSSEWRSPLSTSTEPAYVTPLVGFAVEVRGSIPGREGKDETVAWKMVVDDTTSGKMLAIDSNGQRRGQRELLEDAFARYLEGVPGQIAQSFHTKL
ncbi:MAG: hypothetical protein QM820_14920 [Minicystis sp.]